MHQDREKLESQLIEYFKECDSKLHSLIDHTIWQTIGDWFLSLFKKKRFDYLDINFQPFSLFTRTTFIWSESGNLFTNQYRRDIDWLQFGKSNNGNAFTGLSSIDPCIDILETLLAPRKLVRGDTEAELEGNDLREANLKWHRQELKDLFFTFCKKRDEFKVSMTDFVSGVIEELFSTSIHSVACVPLIGFRSKLDKISFGDIVIHK